MPGSLKDRQKRYELTKPLRGIFGGQIWSRSAGIHEHFWTQEAATNSFINTQTGAGTALTLTANALSGEATAVTGAVSGNAHSISTGRSFQPNTTAAFVPMVIEVRMKVSATTTEFSVGFKSTTAPASDIDDALSLTSTVTTAVSANQAAFLYSNTPTSGDFFKAGGNVLGWITSNAGVNTVQVPGVTASVPAPVANAGVALVMDTAYHVYRIELDSAGDASFYLDDQFYGAVGGSMALTAPLGANINFITRSAAAATVTIDYISAWDGGVNTGAQAGY